MKARRQGLKTINILRGRPAGEISVQSDGIFNNPLYSGIGKTPFQPATQCSYTMVENITPKKMLINCVPNMDFIQFKMTKGVTLNPSNAHLLYLWCKVLEMKKNGQKHVC